MKLMLSKYAQIYTLWFKYRINIKNPRRFSEHQDNLRYALITFVLSYTPHSGNLGPQKMDSGVFIFISTWNHAFIVGYDAMNPCIKFKASGPFVETLCVF